MSIVIAVKLGDDLHNKLKLIGTRESRLLGAQALFFLETCAIAAQREPALRYKLEMVPEQPFMKNCSKFVLEDGLFDYYSEWACCYGIRVAPFVRMVLHTAIRCYERLAPTRVLGKEEFIGVLVDQVRSMPSHAD